MSWLVDMSDDEVKVHPIRLEDIEDAFEEARDRIMNNLGYLGGLYKEVDLLEALKRLDMQLWLIKKNDILVGVMITQINENRYDSRLTIVFMQGDDLSEFVHYSTKLFEWAKYMGCSRVELFGRLGWHKRLNQLGFDFEHLFTAFGMEL